MQAKAPEPLPQKKRRPTVAVTNVPQEAFTPIGLKLAEALGWKGEDHFVGNGVTVRDARRYITKILHEAHQAGAKGLPVPEIDAAHLGIDTEDEIKALESALAAAHATGKDAVKSEVPVKRVSMDTDMEGSAGALLSRFQAHESKLKERK